MIIVINGVFGVGKTTVARLLRSRLTGSVVCDPEPLGVVLKHASRWFTLAGSGTEDFQDLALWRRLTVALVRLKRRFARGPVIMPMTFSNLAYLNEVAAGFRKFDSDVKVFCLNADIETIERRLASRGHDNGQWVRSRIADCLALHRDKDFSEPVDTSRMTADKVADYILKRLTARGTD